MERQVRPGGQLTLSYLSHFRSPGGRSIFIISHLPYLFQPNLFHVEPVQVVKHLRNNLNPSKSVSGDSIRGVQPGGHVACVFISYV